MFSTARIRCLNHIESLMIFSISNCLVLQFLWHESHFFRHVLIPAVGLDLQRNFHEFNYCTKTWGNENRKD
jgi:hypothetical protein